MSASHSTRVRTALFTVPLAVGVLGGAVPAGAASARAATSATGTSLTCRGMGVDPGAVVRYRTQTVIHAPLRTIWNLQTDVKRWPSSQSAVTTVKRIDSGPFGRSSAFGWTTPVPATASTPSTTVVVTSTVRHIRRDSCIRWTGPAIAGGVLRIEGVHAWNFTRVKGGVLVSTEETHTGAQVDADPAAATAILGAGLETWLHDLKSAAEARSGDRSHGRR